MLLKLTLRKRDKYMHRLRDSMIHSRNETFFQRFHFELFAMKFEFKQKVILFICYFSFLHSFALYTEFNHSLGFFRICFLKNYFCLRLHFSGQKKNNNNNKTIPIFSV